MSLRSWLLHSKDGADAPQFGNQLDLEHPLEIADPAGAAGASLEADHALHRRHVVEAPAAKVILEIDQLLGELIEHPVGFGRLIDAAPGLQHALVEMMGFAHVA